MRKWRIIALSAIVIIAVGISVFVLSQPKPGTIEWHKREYLFAWNRATEDTFSDRIVRTYHKVKGTASVPVAWGSREKELMSNLRSNRSALVRIGYLVERRFALKNENAYNVQVTILTEYGGTDAMTKAFVSLSGTDDVLDVTAPVFAIPRLEEIVREADVPKRADGQ